jgi:hypothetical protein
LLHYSKEDYIAEYLGYKASGPETLGAGREHFRLPVVDSSSIASTDRVHSLRGIGNQK